MRPSIHLVCATRVSVQNFQSRTWLGCCLPRIGQLEPLGLHLYAENRLPLAKVYNEAIDAAHPEDLLVFVHDDVYIDDWLLSCRLREALQTFDLVGVAGNRRRQDGQHTWYLQPMPDTSTGQPDWALATLDAEFLSGAIAHGPGVAQSRLTLYGPSPSAVVLLDGVFMAVRAGLLQASGVRFDPLLAFHFYDLDFCRSALGAGLRLGTWPIALTHQSGGESVKSDSWLRARAHYLEKWST